ncbi:MAG: beta-galactosidase [Thermoflexales bacterium]|nr:beta-galactosidase [Thermoflexales bacterium]
MVLFKHTRFDAAARLALLIIVLWAFESPPRLLVTPGPPQTVHTSNSLVGVHTRLTDEVETWKIQRSLAMVAEMGAPWIVEFFPWAYIEPVRGRFTWGHADKIIQHSRAQGLTVIARLGLVPAWARPDPLDQESTYNYLAPDSYADWGDFVHEFAARYAGQVEHIIIWNEPNLAFEWGLRPPDPAAYTALLQVSYARAKEANPNVVVLAGALAPTLEPEGSPHGLNDLIYLERMYEAGAGDYFDALAAHSYGLQNPAEQEAAPDRLNFRRVELLRQVMERYGDRDKAVYITESGWNDSPRWIYGVTPAQRVQYTLGAYEWARHNWPWCKVVAIWAFRLPQAGQGYQDGFTFVSPTFQPKPIYLEVQKYTR